jgi:hypothetical protein
MGSFGVNQQPDIEATTGITQHQVPPSSEPRSPRGLGSYSHMASQCGYSPNRSTKPARNGLATT